MQRRLRPRRIRVSIVDWTLPRIYDVTQSRASRDFERTTKYVKQRDSINLRQYGGVSRSFLCYKRVICQMHDPRLEMKYVGSDQRPQKL